MARRPFEMIVEAPCTTSSRSENFGARGIRHLPEQAIKGGYVLSRFPTGIVRSNLTTGPRRSTSRAAAEEPPLQMHSRLISGSLENIELLGVGSPRSMRSQNPPMRNPVGDLQVPYAASLRSQLPWCAPARSDSGPPTASKRGHPPEPVNRRCCPRPHRRAALVRDRFDFPLPLGPVTRLRGPRGSTSSRILL